MSARGGDMEALLREALAPVEPGEGFPLRLESALSDITAAAAEELESWELSAMRDPRNWARPAAALLIGGSAAGALVLLRAHRRHQEVAELAHTPAQRALQSGKQALGELRAEAGRLLRAPRR
ncbi:MAG TPA: hypothetical protein VKU89_08390 [Solirubrobacteraceae bacterium]|nr:hypothetical protein [Solirubrobacteraceae bacterium]